MSCLAVSSDGTIREGKAVILPNAQAKKEDGKKEEGKTRDDVFYNPAQVFNRDISLLVVSVFARIRKVEVEEKQRRREESAKKAGRPSYSGPLPGLHILEALSATGIRSIRYAKELGEGPEGIRRIVANDLDETAVAHIRRNLVHNGIGSCIEATCGDAAAHMYAHKARGPGGLGDAGYAVIDIDPYGTASPFLDAAVQAVADGGLLCITSTDMPVLGGNHPETCFSRYGGTAFKAGYVHEMALRLVLHAASTSAAKYGREVRPLLCLSVDFYVRIFVRVFDQAIRTKYQASKTGVVHQCQQCESFFVQPFGEVLGDANPKFKPAKCVAPGMECPECQGRLKIGGPLHIGSLYDGDFVKLCLEACEQGSSRFPGITTWKKITGILRAIAEETVDVPLHYKLPLLLKSLKMVPMPLRTFRGTLKALGYSVSHFHREPEAIKTDAPNAVVYDLLRLWAEEHPPKGMPLPEILKKPLTVTKPIEWSSEQDDSTKKKKMFPQNPPFWGPGTKAKGGSMPSEDAPVEETGAQGVPNEAAETETPVVPTEATEARSEAAVSTVVDGGASESRQEAVPETAASEARSDAVVASTEPPLKRQRCEGEGDGVENI